MKWLTRADPLLVQPRRTASSTHIYPHSQSAALGTKIVYERGVPTRIGLEAFEMRPSTFETVAVRMLARDGVEVIWQLHLRAAGSYGRGNWVSALALVRNG